MNCKVEVTFSYNDSDDDPTLGPNILLKNDSYTNDENDCDTQADDTANEIN